MPAPSLKYAHVERERRWLLAGVPDLPTAAEVLRISDRYLCGSRLRLREVRRPDGSVERKLGHKVRIGDGPQAVACTSLYLDDAEWDLLAALPADTLTKDRTLVPHDGFTVAVDVFTRRLAGLVLAEVDTGDGPAIELPESYAAVREVTADEAFTGAVLARVPNSG